MPVPTPPPRGAGLTVPRSFRIPAELDAKLLAIAKRYESDFTSVVLTYLNYSVAEFEREHGSISEDESKPKAAHR